LHGGAGGFQLSVASHLKVSRTLHGSKPAHDAPVTGELAMGTVTDTRIGSEARGAREQQRAEALGERQPDTACSRER
jgi:hypothetical protein